MKYFIFLLYFFITSLHAQTIEFIVSASPGGPADSLTRQIVKHLQKEIDLKFVILNKPGASHTIAYNYIKNSNKQILIVSNSEITNHEVHEQLDEIQHIGNFSMYLFVSKKSGITNFEELKELAQQREILFGHSGQQTFSFAGLEYICRTLTNCLPIPYKSGNDGILGLLSNQIDAYTIVSYGSKNYLQNQNLALINIFKLKNNQTVLYSKNLNKSLQEQIKNILQKIITKEFLSELGLEKND